ncbi:MAG TPA: hypothetical protein VFI67_02945 [Sphingomicrobium sp.]|nr:hypothetical protein [Sphingomicrobium sp.]
MSDGPEWFVPKRYGYGATPVTWQGWTLTFGFVAIVFLLSIIFRHRVILLFAALAPFLIAFIVICARTTKGGWRWRWGDDD